MSRIDKKITASLQNSSQLDKKLMISYFLKSSKHFVQASRFLSSTSFFLPFFKRQEKKTATRSSMREKLWLSLLH